MAVGSIYTAKDQRAGFQPLVLISIAWPDGTVARYSTHDLTGANAFGGYQWEPRLMNGAMAAAQAISAAGIDVPPTMDIKLADPDGAVWAIVMSKGLLGAIVTATLLLYDIATNTFSTDTWTPFVGVANPPTSIEFDSLSFTADSKMNMQRKFIPTAQIQQLCQWDFPATFADRQKAAGPSDQSGICRCGYSADVSGGIGNLDPSTGQAYTSCGFAYTDCLARLGNGRTLGVDNSGRHTGSFSGIRFQPAASYYSKNYISGNWTFGINNPNLGKYSQPVPLAYGTVMATPVTVVTTGDSNLTAMESILCFDQIQAKDITLVEMNNTLIFESGDAFNPSGSGGTVIAGFWNLVNDGSERGRCNPDTLFNSLGDSYGSMATIHTRVPVALQTAASNGSLQVRFNGRSVRVYYAGTPQNIAGVAYGPPPTVYVPGHGFATGDLVQIAGAVGDTGLNGQFAVAVVDADHFTLPSALKLGTWTVGGTVTKWEYNVEWSSNPVWALVDLLIWGDWDYSDISIAAAVADAAYCDTSIPYTTVWGDASAHARFSISLYINQTRGAGELIRAVRLGFRCGLRPSSNGLLQIQIEKTLAEQQPAPITGSNYNTPIASVLADGTTGVFGYAAYDFNDSNILRKSGKKDGPPSLRFTSRKRQESPNKLSCAIQDVENSNSIDSYTQYCVPAQNLMGDTISSTFQAEGINTYDQAQRVFGLQFAKTFLGNYTSDYTGTLFPEWEAGPWALHLSVGDIVRVSSVQKNLSPTLVRITGIKPDTNFRTITLTGNFHDDVWYEDAFQQNPGSGAATLANAALLRPPFAWRGNNANPAAGDPMWSSSEGFFGLALGYGTDAAGNPTPTITVTGYDPINLFSTLTLPPYVPLQGTTSNAGGTIPGGQWVFLALCAKDTAGATYGTSQPSTVCQIFIAGGTNTNTATVAGLKYQPGTAGYVLLAGTDPSAMTVQQVSDTLPTSITITSLSVGTSGPDQQFDHFLVRVWRVAHSGPVGAALSGVTSGSLTCAGIEWTMTQWDGYDCSVIGFADDPAAVPIANYNIVGSTTDTLTLATGGPSPVAANVQPGDVVIIRSKPSAWGSNYYTDPGWNNSSATFALQTLFAVSGGGTVTVTLTAHGLSTGAQVRIYNGADITGIWTITVVDANTFTLNGATSTTYFGGGYVAALSGGLIPDAERGRLLVAISGTGRGMWNRIASNTQTTIYIEGTFAIMPDATTRFIILYPEPVVEQPTPHLDSATLSTLATIVAPVPNDKNQPLAIGVFAVGSNGAESFQHLTQIREIYAYGNPGNASLIAPGYDTVVPDGSGNVHIDLANGLNQRLVLNSAISATVIAPVWTGGAIVAGTAFTMYFDQPAGGKCSLPTFLNAPGAFVGTSAFEDIDGTQYTRTVILFRFHGTYWGPDNQDTGKPIS